MVSPNTLTASPEQSSERIENDHAPPSPEVNGKSYESTYFLVRARDKATNRGNPELADRINDFLTRHTGELVRSGDNLPARYLAGLLEGVEAAQARPGAEFLTPWVSVDLASPDAEATLGAIDEAMETLGYQVAGREPAVKKSR